MRSLSPWLQLGSLVCHACTILFSTQCAPHECGPVPNHNTTGNLNTGGTSSPGSSPLLARSNSSIPIWQYNELERQRQHLAAVELPSNQLAWAIPNGSGQVMIFDLSGLRDSFRRFPVIMTLRPPANLISLAPSNNTASSSLDTKDDANTSPSSSSPSQRVPTERAVQLVIGQFGALEGALIYATEAIIPPVDDTDATDKPARFSPPSSPLIGGITDRKQLMRVTSGARLAPPILTSSTTPSTSTSTSPLPASNVVATEARGQGSIVRAYDIHTGRCILQFTPHTRVAHIAALADGHLVTASRYGILSITHIHRSYSTLICL
jgi:hypothetical protein